jgi:hypothetical protein
MPPIGSTTNELANCSPCAEQPVDCTKAVSELNAAVCALRGQYAEMLRKYGKLQGKLVTQAQYIKQFLDEQTRLRRLISESGGDAGCGGANDAETADSIMVCDGGVPKGLPPGSNCARIFGEGGKWKVGGPGIHWLAAGQVLGLGNNTGLTDYDEVTEHGCIVAAIVESNISISGDSSTSGQFSVLANGVVVSAVGLSGGGFDGAGGQAIVPLNSQLITIAHANTFTGAYTYAHKLHGYLIG